MYRLYSSRVHAISDLTGRFGSPGPSCAHSYGRLWAGEQLATDLWTWTNTEHTLQQQQSWIWTYTKHMLQQQQSLVVLHQRMALFSGISTCLHHFSSYLVASTTFLLNINLFSWKYIILAATLILQRKWKHKPFICCTNHNYPKLYHLPRNKWITDSYIREIIHCASNSILGGSTDRRQDNLFYSTETYYSYCSSEG